MDWYMYRNNAQNGPYSEEVLKKWLAEGLLVQSDLFCRPGGNWLGFDDFRRQLAETPFPPEPSREPGYSSVQTPQPVYTGAPQTDYAASGRTDKAKKTKPPKQKKRGCLGCLTVFLAVVLLIGGGIFLLMNRDSKNITVEGKQKAASQTITPSGGSVDFSLGESGTAKLVVPEGAYGKNINCSVTTEQIKEHKFGEYFNPVSPLITIDNNHEFAEEPMLLTIPVRLAENEFAMAFYYDRKTGELEGLPLVSETSDSITVATKHFSGIVAAKTDISAFANVSVETGFAPGYDDWQFVNYGSFVAPGGHCAGQSISEMWYYREKYKRGNEKRLNGRFDNNDTGNSTESFWEDDSWGYRMSSVVQSKCQWDTKGIESARRLRKLSDKYTYEALAYSMMVTKEPQFVAIYTLDAKGAITGGHAIVAYKMENNKIFVADPNFPGKDNRYIQFNMGNNTFSPYSSGANAADISAGNGVSYPAVEYYGVTAMIDWETISKEYGKMIDGVSGNDEFPQASLEYLKEIKDTGEEVWEKCPDMIELNLEDTAKVSEEDAGKIFFRIKPQYSNLCCSLYDGTDLKEAPGLLNPKTGFISYAVDLKNGANDLGFFLQIYQNQRYYYSDFKRVKVMYEDVDLSGTWKGKIEVTEAGKIIDFIADIWTKFYVGIMQSAEEPVDEYQVKTDTIEALEKQIYGQKMPVELEIRKKTPDDKMNYYVTVKLTAADGTTVSYESELKYSNQEMEFKITDSASNSRMVFTCYLQGDGILQGRFTVHAWSGILRNAYKGVWKAELQD